MQKASDNHCQRGNWESDREVHEAGGRGLLHEQILKLKLGKGAEVDKPVYTQPGLYSGLVPRPHGNTLHLVMG